MSSMHSTNFQNAVEGNVHILEEMELFASMNSDPDSQLLQTLAQMSHSSLVRCIHIATSFHVEIDSFVR